MSDLSLHRRAVVEPLEARIAPAGVLTANWKIATPGAPIELFAGDGLSTGGANSGSYLLYVEKGSALVFLTDINGDGDIDFNEVTGIAAGDGLKLTSFVDIHGDIATNLQVTTGVISGVTSVRLALTDSDSNRSNDLRQLGDGRVLANSKIESITLRSLTLADIPDQNGDALVDEADLALRKAYTTYSIYGDIYAGAGFGVTGGGLLIDTANGTGLPENFGQPFVPSIGAIRVGTAASGEYFSFGVSGTKAAGADPSRYDDYTGTFAAFTPASSQAGGDIIGVRAATLATAFNLEGLYAGNGGFAARGGNILDVTVSRDDSGGYEVIAGTGGRGVTGGAGGSILNFTDLGSQTSQVKIRSGNGGVSTSGAGGNGGTFSIGTFNVFGGVDITLGSGGDGFTAGGNGAALTKGVFNQPTTVTFDPGNAVGTIHQPLVYDPNPNVPNSFQPVVGTHQGVDFDGDGFGDVVFTSKGDSQLVVQFGNGSGGARRIVFPDGTTAMDRIYLSGVPNAEGLTVNDYNGDGLLDIAVASGDLGSNSGIAVYLNKGSEDVNRDGTLSPAEDLDRDGANDFYGFHSARYSVLPQFGETVQVGSLTSGDYDGDGKIEIAAVVTYYNQATVDAASGLVISLGQPRQWLVYMTPDEEFNTETGRTELNGQFYSDVGTVTAPRLPYTQIAGFDLGSDLGNYRSVVVETSALVDSTGANPSLHDVIFVGVRERGEAAFRAVNVIDYASRDPLVGVGARTPVSVGSYVLGRVDTNRDLSDAGTADRKSLVDITLRDFTVFDSNADGVADLGVISAAPDLYLVGIVGAVTTNAAGQTVIGTQNSGSNGGSLPFPNGASGAGNNANDNQGNYFGNKGRDLDTGTLMTIRSADIDGNGVIDDLVILDSDGELVLIDYRPGVQPTDAPAAATTGARYLGLVQATDDGGGGRNEDAGAEFFGDVFLADANDARTAFFVVSEFDGQVTNRVNFAELDPLVVLRSDSFANGEVGFRLAAGNGGDAFVGKGGVGGQIGSGSTLSNRTDPVTGLTVVDLVGSIQLNLNGTARITSGVGGDGFTTGGRGGSITGVVLRPPVFNDELDVTAVLIAGDGGRGVSGVGGVGGSLTQNSINADDRPATFFAGNGGDGRIGGAGGTVLGNGSSVYDSASRSLNVVAGAGGDGIKGGGAGGRIENFSPSITLAGSSLRYVAGNGGNAVAGTGGAGGSVLKSSPKLGDFIQSEIFIRAGDGGDGLAGGAGGSVATFITKPAPTSAQPTILSVLAGSGGGGLSGNGGNGGNVSNISVGTAPFGSVVGTFSRFAYSRLVAGDGGDSSGARGGNGGVVADIVDTGSTTGSIAFVAGAGGDGLYGGGNGGGVARVNFFLGTGTQSKALVVAGEGGGAGAFISNSNDSAPNQTKNAFGGRVGIGGNGGSISEITQTGSVGSHVDLIAGNGGDTRNYGSIRDTRAFVGKGGSISNVKLSGDVGNLQADDPNTAFAENVRIKSYNNILGGETMSDWVNSVIRRDVAVPGLAVLTDAQGNVGIIVGTAGLNKPVVTNIGTPDVYVPLPAPGTVNGNLTNIEARNILSAVAGNVDQIARIQIAKNIRVLGGVIGADKGVVGGGADGVIGQNDYLDPNGVPTADGRPVLDGRLVDGALIARSVVNSAGVPVALPGRIYNL